jgi:NADPH-dependent 2,4-dienoyl-CoA reductase/sulfur reductase-like enzyme
MTRSFDIVVVGAGPAGIAAACAAAEQGQQVALLDDNPAPGGQIWRGPSTAHRDAVSRAKERWLHRLQQNAAITSLHGCRVFDLPGDGLLAAEQNGQRVELRYSKLILATGARELFLPFPGWTLPGVYGAGGLQAMVKAGLPVGDQRVVVAGSGPLLLAVAAYLREAGAHVTAVYEQASWLRLLRFGASISITSRLWQAAGYRWRTRSIPFRAGCWPVAAHGGKRLGAVTLSNGVRQWTVACDLLACGFHLVPNTELASLLGCALQQGFVTVDALQQTSVTNVFCAGEPTGIGGLELSLAEGEIAGLAAAGAIDAAQTHIPRRDRLRPFAAGLATTFALRQELRSLPQADTIVCRCEDVTWRTVSQYTGWRAAKLQTRCGMGPCQGRICGNTLHFLSGWTPDSVRPPIFPVSIASLAGPTAPAPAEPSVIQEN